jgi:hypothetical protein
LVGRITTAEEEEEQNLGGQSYVEIGDYELQEQDPYKIQCESDLTEVQEEYFRQEWIDPRSYE